LNVTAIVAILSRARAHILRLTSARLHDLVVSDWAARAVLRYRRLQSRWPRILTLRRPGRMRPSLTLVGHALVLTLGFVLVVPVTSGRSAPTPTLAVQYSGQLLGTGPLHNHGVPDMREVVKASTLEERPAPVAEQPVARPTPRAAGTFTPPPGSGGDGLAAIYAVFGNSPGLSWALRVANCESHYNPLAINRSSGASGLFQFMPATWNANFPGQNIWDPYAQARGALKFYNSGRQSAWTCK
jgi:transglycosylase-like protein with SLT domain